MDFCGICFYVAYILSSRTADTVIFIFPMNQRPLHFHSYLLLPFLFSEMFDAYAENVQRDKVASQIAIALMAYSVNGTTAIYTRSPR